MGRHKKGFNWKSRVQKEGTLDNTETLKLQSTLTDSSLREGNVNDPNVTVLPSKKRTFKLNKISGVKPKLLSKKRRKELEKISDRKTKKAARAGLLEKLCQVQVPEEELKSLMSLSQVQTKGLKRQFAEDERLKYLGEHPPQPPSSSDKPIVPVPRSKRYKTHVNNLHTSYDPNVLGFESSSSESEDETEEEDEERNQKMETAQLETSKENKMNVSIPDNTTPSTTNQTDTSAGPPKFEKSQTDSSIKELAQKPPTLPTRKTFLFL
ncbi:DHX37 [Lepeophtheirus salmonis]|uniref:DHX37 n=1 Tax=Lepeophtheirus salmonis TaxID=72036 RepID=A0A7R8D234_LEPSM|nr:DHX37 [Lepeophtheirus salmonis]CAF2973539.1 DHX37 [Lepeophtheirus salmonis]